MHKTDLEIANNASKKHMDDNTYVAKSYDEFCLLYTSDAADE